jgi:Protein of unknown function (DUF1580).
MTSISTTYELAQETLVPINQAGAKFPYHVGRTALERWMRDGVRGVRLESILIGSRRFTSVEAIARFVEQSNQQRDSHGNVRMTQTELRSNREELGLNRNEKKN